MPRKQTLPRNECELCNKVYHNYVAVHEQSELHVENVMKKQLGLSADVRICIHCERQLGSDQALSRHRKVCKEKPDNDVAQYFCPFCSFQSPRADNAKDHIARRHPEEMKNFDEIVVINKT